jgi:hypothetical protein
MFSFFMSLVREKGTEKMATKIFDHFVLILGLSLCVFYHHKKRETAFFYILGKSVFSSVQFTVPAFVVFIFVVLQSFENKKKKMTELLSMDNYWAPRVDQWTIRGTKHFVTHKRNLANNTGRGDKTDNGY